MLLNSRRHWVANSLLNSTLIGILALFPVGLSVAQGSKGAGIYSSDFKKFDDKAFSIVASQEAKGRSNSGIQFELEKAFGKKIKMARVPVVEAWTVIEDSDTKQGIKSHGRNVLTVGSYFSVAFFLRGKCVSDKIIRTASAGDAVSFESDDFVYIGKKDFGNGVRRNVIVISCTSISLSIRR